MIAGMRSNGEEFQIEQVFSFKNIYFVQSNLHVPKAAAKFNIGLVGRDVT